MRDLYPRLFEPPYVEPDVPNPRRLEEREYRAAAVAAAIRAGGRNGAAIAPADVTFPTSGFAPARVTVQVRGDARVSPGGEGSRARSRIPIRASATAELSPAAGEAFPGTATGGGYDGPLAYRQGEPMSCLSDSGSGSRRSTGNSGCSSLR
jgi:hypothetical protein